MPAVTSSRYLVMAGWDDVPHLDEKTKRELLESTPAHLRDARSKGIPVLGSGRIFLVDEELIAEQPIQLPDHWPRLAGLDFGWDHPTAVVWGAWDRDTDVVHIYDIHRVSEQPVAIHADAIKTRGAWIPVAWPHDGLQHEKGSGIQMAKQYRDKGVAMMPNHAQYVEEGSDNETAAAKTSLEASVSDMLSRMVEGRLKVAKHLAPWFDEFRLYHRKDGKIVKVRDDLLSATRYLLMSLRYAMTEPKPSTASTRRFNWKVI